MGGRNGAGMWLLGCTMAGVIVPEGGREGPPASFYRYYFRKAMNSCCLPLPASSYTAVKIRKGKKTVHALEKVPFSLGTIANSVSICEQQGSG